MSPVIHIFNTPLAPHIAPYIKESAPDAKRLAMLADSNTYNALGRDVHEALLEMYDIELRLLPSHIQADKAIAEVLSAQLSHAEALVCVGSGTLNDIAKYITHQLNMPYLLCPTAASMNGYSSATSSLLNQGYKGSIPTHAADTILIESEVIARAPTRLTQAGFGDSICRSLSQCDAYLSHRLLGTRYEAKWFDSQSKHEEAVLSNIEGLIQEDTSQIDSLFQWLLASGDAMRKAGSSIPASQAEHMIAHLLEMMQGDGLHAHYHGEEIAVTSVTVARQYEILLSSESITLSALPKEQAKARLAEHFSDEMCETFLSNAQKKGIFDSARIDELNDVLQHHWHDIRAKLQSHFIGSQALESSLQSAGLKTTPKEMGWNEAMYEAATALAPLTRDRFTVLDMLLLAQGSEN